MGSVSRTVIHLVPHTHWDREWYEPFQTFRLRLVALIDELVERMTNDLRLAFTLDGQMATIDDYLEIRPEAEPTIRRLIAEGRLAVGPWQILMDEFLVSGENIVRNLEIGWASAEELGGAMPVGYLPDMFGHIAQMPQILRRAGIDRAVVWRGVPAAIDRDTFAWRSPDGSWVIAEYLPSGYGNAAHLFDVPDQLARRLADLRAESAGFHPDHSILAMYGTDHSVPAARLADLVDETNRAQDEFEVRIETLSDYFAREHGDAGNSNADGMRGEGRGVGRVLEWTGELRSGARANLLMNVTSNHMDVKAACARAERLLERYAEPLAALHGRAWPQRLLELAWRRVIDSSAHDSICACSHDMVVAQVLLRFAEAEQLARGVLGGTMAEIAAGLPRRTWAVANPSPADRTDLVALDVAVPADWDGFAIHVGGNPVPIQETGRVERMVQRLTLTGREVPDFFRRRIHGRELFGRLINHALIEREGDRSRLLIEVDSEPDPVALDVGALLDGVGSAAQRSPDEEVDVVVLAPDRRWVLAQVAAPGLGWSTAELVESTPGAQSAAVGDAVHVTARSISNGLLQVEVREDGTLDVAGRGVTLSSVGRLVDGGDFGDSYNYAPPAVDELVDQPLSVQTETSAHGPLVGELVISCRYSWPEAVDETSSARSERRVDTEVTTHVELRAGEPFVRLRVEFENRCRDHRLRWHIPLPMMASRSAAEGQFAVVERGLTGEGGHGEFPLPTFPARSFVDAAGVAVLLDHVTEYELVEGRELALTILRCTGLISRNNNPFREEPAGPEVPIPSAQLPGPWSFGFAVYPHLGRWDEGGVLEAAERYRHRFEVVPGTDATTDRPPSPTHGPTSRRGLLIEGPGVSLSALRRCGEWLELRVVAEHPRPTEAVVRGPFDEAIAVDLLGQPGEALPCEPGLLRLALGSFEIRSVRLRQRAPRREQAKA